MEDEFPELEFQNYQNEFLEDWWTRKKLFKGYRQSGKTTLILSELDRFLRYDMDCLVLAPTNKMAERVKTRYHKRFGKIPDCDFKSFDQSLRGSPPVDVVLIDEIHKLDLEKMERQIVPMNPIFIRACGSKSDCCDSFFQSVYKV